MLVHQVDAGKENAGPAEAARNDATLSAMPSNMIVGAFAFAAAREARIFYLPVHAEPTPATI